MIKALYNAESFKAQSDDFRIGAVISDGMWYSLPKWRKIAKVSEEAINEWIDEHLSDGSLMQSETGAKSYRFPMESIEEWYASQGLEVGVQLVDFLFPPRIWGGYTETDGFLEAPLRETGVVSFECANHVAEQIREELAGIAKVREISPNKYKAYCLDNDYAKTIVQRIYKDCKMAETGKMHSRALIRRRELVDLPKDFCDGILSFYKNFAKTLVKGSQETINIFLPDPEDQEAQIIMWLIAAIEKFDERAAVPFSGYLDNVMKKWPYDLPYESLGKELSNFQRSRARAIKELRVTNNVHPQSGRVDFTAHQISSIMGYDTQDFAALEEKHKTWMASKTATTLTWGENSEEKAGDNFVTGLHKTESSTTNPEVAYKISTAVVHAALRSGRFNDAFNVIAQIDSTDLNLTEVQSLSEEFIIALGSEMGIEGGQNGQRAY